MSINENFPGDSGQTVPPGSGAAAKKKKTNWVLWIVLGGLAFCLGSTFLVGAFFLMSRTAKSSIDRNSILVMDMSGPFPENMPYIPIDQVFGDREMTLLNVLENIDKARMDDRIRSIVLDIKFLNIGWAKVEEIRSRLFEFRESGKKVYAYIELGQDKEYYLASAADEIFVAPESYLFIDGLLLSATFLKGTLDKLGVEAQVESAGEYKSFGETYSRESMSILHREMLDALADDSFDRYVETMCFKLEIERDSALKIIDSGILSGMQAYQSGLVDSLMYRDQVVTYANGNNKAEFHKVSGRSYRDVSPQSVDLQEGPQIALVYAVGTIGEGQDGIDPLFGRIMGSASTAKNIREAAENDDVCAIVLRIDSPGGSALAADLIWHEIKNARKKKPVIASMSDVAASGGYYIAAACDSIVASPWTLTGSIGVVSIIFSLEETFEKIGLNVETVKRGRYADFFSNAKTLSREEREKFGKQVQEFYTRFVEKVAEGRGLAFEEVEPNARGRVWSGQMASKLGLVDRVGSLADAIAAAKGMADIPLYEDPEIVTYPRPKKLVDVLLDPKEDFRNRLDAGQDFEEVLPANLVRGIRLLAQFSNGVPSALMPYVIEMN